MGLEKHPEDCMAFQNQQAFICHHTEICAPYCSTDVYICTTVDTMPINCFLFLCFFPSNAPLSFSSKVCYIKYREPSSVGVAQHLTNTVFIDRALIVVPCAEGEYILFAVAYYGVLL